MLNKTSIAYSATGLFPSLFLDYIKAETRLKEFYNASPALISFGSVIENKFSADREILVSVLEEQYTQSGLKNDLTETNIQELLKHNTYTVCTGHQLCLFTGPLYFICKIVSTINLAEQLNKRYPQNKFIPVYWMATEDHDFEEINHVQLFGKKIEWKKENVENAGKLASGKLNTASFNSVLDELKIILGETENAKELLNVFSDAYLNNKELAAAMRLLAHTLFGPKGLVIIDANDKRLKSQFVKVMEDDLFDHTPHKIVTAATNKIEQFGYKTQVNAREINLFYLTETSRERISLSPPSASLRTGSPSPKERGGEYRVLNTEISFTADALKEELKNNPEKFSPNVVLRPLYQQTILPNVAYIGGPAEIAYWLQYKAMFDHYKTVFPILMPRNSVMWLDEKTTKQLQSFGFAVADIFKEENELIKMHLHSLGENIPDLENEENEIRKIFTQVSIKAEQVDKTLKALTEAELTKSLNALKTVSAKMLKAQKQKQETSLNQIKKIKEKLFPEGKSQERYDNFIPFYIKHGRDFFKTLYQNLNPFELEMTVINE